jgi:uncharacterized Fe-S center protein
VEHILVLAKLLYTRLLRKGIWSGIGRTGKFTSMAIASAKGESKQHDETKEIEQRLREKDCWDCGIRPLS